MKIITTYNNKGGVGKTTVSVNLAETLGRDFGKKVLLIDYDPQNSASLMCNIDITQYGAGEVGEEAGMKTIGFLQSGFVWDGEVAGISLINEAIVTPQYLKNKQKEKSIEWDIVSEKFHFDMIPGVGKDLSLIELSFMSMAEQKPFILEDENKKYNRLLLKLIIERIKKNLDYDYVIIDCPPSLGILSMNALAASDSLIIPTTMDMLSTFGIQTILDNLNDLKQYVPNFKVEGVLLNCYSGSRKNDREIEEDLHQLCADEGIEMFATRIPERQMVKNVNSEERIGVQIKGDFKDSFYQLASEIIKGDKENGNT